MFKANHIQFVTFENNSLTYIAISVMCSLFQPWMRTGLMPVPTCHHPPSVILDTSMRQCPTLRLPIPVSLSDLVQPLHWKTCTPATPLDWVRNTKTWYDLVTCSNCCYFYSYTIHANRTPIYKHVSINISLCNIGSFLVLTLNCVWIIGVHFIITLQSLVVF